MTEQTREPLADAVLAFCTRHRLSLRQCAIVTQLVAGNSPQEAARALSVSTKSVYARLCVINARVRVRTTTQLLALFARESIR